MKKRVLSLALVLILIFGLAACGGLEPLPEGSMPGQDAAPESTEAPAPEYQRPQGADSVKTLLEKSLDFLHNDCDYSKIADVHDQLANMAFLLVITEYGSNYATETVSEISWEQALERAKLLFLDAERLRAQDPALAEWTRRSNSGGLPQRQNQ